MLGAYFQYLKVSEKLKANKLLFNVFVLGTQQNNKRARIMVQKHSVFKEDWIQLELGDHVSYKWKILSV